MKRIYSKIWDLAKPYYQKGRPMDVDHIEWMMEAASYVCKQEQIDDTILLPLVIVHDVGYAAVPQGNPFNVDMRKAHMQAGAEIAKTILQLLNYPENITSEIVHYVSIHDNWALGDNQIYQQYNILGVFTDLDFAWMATPKGFPAFMKILNKSRAEMIAHLANDEKLIHRPFRTKTVEQLFYKNLAERQSEDK